MSWPRGVSRKGYKPGTMAKVLASRPEPQPLESQYAFVLKADDRKRFSPYDELGRTGLKQVGGFLQEEFVNDLRGQKGARIYREMVDNNADLGAFFTLVKRLLQQVKWRFEPFSSDPKHVKQAEFFDGCLKDMDHSWPEVLSEILTMLQFGYAPMEVTLKVRRGWSRDPTKRSRFADGLIGWRKIALRAQESIFRWIYDKDNRELLSVIQIPPPVYTQVEIPMDKILNFRTDVERNSPEGRSALRSAYYDYYWYKRLVAIAAIGAERDLNGIPVMSIPAECMRPDATEAERAVYTRARQIVENLRVDEQAGIVIPNQIDPDSKLPLFKLELLSTSGRRAKVDLDAMLKRHQTNMLRAVMADWMMLGTGETGSWALSSDRTDQFGVVLGGIMDIICGLMNRQAIPALAQLNGWDLAELPTMQHGDVESQDLAKLADFIQKTMAAGALTADNELEDYLREQAHLPARLEMDEDTGIETRPQLQPANQTPGEAPPADDSGDGGEQPKEPGLAADQVGKAGFQPRSRAGVFAAGSAGEALRLLRERQRVGSGDNITHGFRVADEVPWKNAREMTREVEAAPVQQIELKGLLATEPSVKRGLVRAFVENPQLVPPGQRNMAGTLEDLPVVVSHGGRRYIQDGHHRLAAKRLAGQQTALARVVEMPQWISKTPPWRVEHRGDKWLVVGTENGKTYGTHDTEEEAQVNLRALYANVPDAKKTQDALTQEET